MVDDVELMIIDLDMRDSSDVCEDCVSWKSSNRCAVTGALVFYDHIKCDEFIPKLNG